LAKDRHEVSIVPLGGGRFRVTVDGATTHDVSVPAEFVSRIGWDDTPEELIRKSFEFLLEREPKEAILESFELPLISSYFPDYEEALIR
jgi:hypothetical protein